MSMTFTKLFSSITASTIWSEPDHTRLVWITMLAMADQHGRVWASIPGLANMARVSMANCESALEALAGPDKYSRTKTHEGRRIEEMDGGWRLLNHSKYREIRDEESIKESKRKWAAKHRAMLKAKEVDAVEKSRSQSNNIDRSRANTEAEAESEAESEADTEAKKEKKTTRVAALSVADLVSQGVLREHAEDWFKTRKVPLTRTAWAAVVAEAEKAGLTIAEAVKIAAERQWRGFKAEWIHPADRAAATGKNPEFAGGI
jgi:hypothetical protein